MRSFSLDSELVEVAVGRRSTTKDFAYHPHAWPVVNKGAKRCSSTRMPLSSDLFPAVLPSPFEPASQLEPTLELSFCALKTPSHSGPNALPSRDLQLATPPSLAKTLTYPNTPRSPTAAAAAGPPKPDAPAECEGEREALCSGADDSSTRQRVRRSASQLLQKAGRIKALLCSVVACFRGSADAH